MNKIKHLLIIASCFLVSCNNQSPVKETCTLHINNHACTYEGLKESYMVGDTASITFKVNELFNLPKKEDIKIYGSQDYTYDEATGVLNVLLAANTGVDVTAIPRIGGHESSFGEVRKFSYDHLPDDPDEEDIPFNKVEVAWNFPALDENQGYDATIIKATLYNLFDLDYDVSPYNLKKDKVVIDLNESSYGEVVFGYFYLETQLYRNRIFVDALKDIFTINEESQVAECLIHNVKSYSGNNLQIASPSIFTINGQDIITKARLCLENGDIVYKGVTFHTSGYIEMTYFTEVAA